MYLALLLLSLLALICSQWDEQIRRSNRRRDAWKARMDREAEAARRMHRITQTKVKRIVEKQTVLGSTYYTVQHDSL